MLHKDTVVLCQISKFYIGLVIQVSYRPAFVKYVLACFIDILYILEEIGEFQRGYGRPEFNTRLPYCLNIYERLDTQQNVVLLFSHMVLQVSLSETNRHAPQPQAAHSRLVRLTTIYISKDRPAYAGRVGAAAHSTVDLWKAGHFLFLGCRTRGTRLGRPNWSPMGILMKCTCYVYAGGLVARHLASMKVRGFSYTFPTLPRPGAPISASPTICSSLPRLHCNA